MTPARPRRPDRRLAAVLIAVGAVLGAGWLFDRLPGRGFIQEPAAPAATASAPAQPDRPELAARPDPAEPAAAAEEPADPRREPAAHAGQAREREVQARFQQGVSMLHAKRYELAVTALHRVLELAPTLVEAHVNMGYALIGAERPRAAADFFLSAIELRPRQANAYYGLGLALEALEDYPGALGAMRTFIHLSDPADPYVRKARSALWEWQSRLDAALAAAESAGESDSTSAPVPVQAQ